MIVTLYEKSDCPLCDEARELLEELAAEFDFELREVDITQDARLFRRYRYFIPVIEIGDVRLYAPIDPRKLRSALEAASC
ncbi:MAG TPA: glutaredoxin family protein [Caldilineae bacterium]|jgi:glutaredoxin|nr:glutaredoxin family protein [Caldilineae bacterium]